MLVKKKPIMNIVEVKKEKKARRKWVRSSISRETNLYKGWKVVGANLISFSTQQANTFSIMQESCKKSQRHMLPVYELSLSLLACLRRIYSLLCMLLGIQFLGLQGRRPHPIQTFKFLPSEKTIITLYIYIYVIICVPVHIQWAKNPYSFLLLLLHPCRFFFFQTAAGLPFKVKRNLTLVTWPRGTHSKKLHNRKWRHILSLRYTGAGLVLAIFVCTISIY